MCIWEHLIISNEYTKTHTYLSHPCLILNKTLTLKLFHDYGHKIHARLGLQINFMSFNIYSQHVAIIKTLSINSVLLLCKNKSLLHINHSSVTIRAWNFSSYIPIDSIYVFIIYVMDKFNDENENRYCLIVRGFFVSNCKLDLFHLINKIQYILQYILMTQMQK